MSLETNQIPFCPTEVCRSISLLQNETFIAVFHTYLTEIWTIYWQSQSYHKMTHFSFFSKSVVFFSAEDFAQYWNNVEWNTFLCSIAVEKLKRLTLAFFNLLIQSGNINFLLQFCEACFSCVTLRCTPKIDKAKSSKKPNVSRFV